jgi:hypothetical protein
MLFSWVVGDGSKGVLQLFFGINVVRKAWLLYQVRMDIYGWRLVKKGGAFCVWCNTCTIDSK